MAAWEDAGYWQITVAVVVAERFFLAETLPMSAGQVDFAVAGMAGTPGMTVTNQAVQGQAGVGVVII
jgi:hypothetical protein